MNDNSELQLAGNFCCRLQSHLSSLSRLAVVHTFCFSFLSLHNFLVWLPIYRSVSMSWQSLHAAICARQVRVTWLCRRQEQLTSVHEAFQSLVR